jgi:hypothetical protein
VHAVAGLPDAATVAYLFRIMLAHPRTLPSGFIAPCLPTKAATLPSGGAWLQKTFNEILLTKLFEVLT